MSADRLAPVIVAARRTAIATASRGFANHTVDALAAPVIAGVAAAVAPSGLPVDDVVLGNCMGPGGDLARVAALRAGLGADVPGVTVDRQCGSGLDAVMQAASRVRAGDAAVVIAGGAESASTAPHRHWPGSGERYTRAPFTPVGFPDPDMGPAAEHLARVRRIPRHRQDAWAARSHARAVAAQAAGAFDDEIVPVDGVARDDRPVPRWISPASSGSRRRSRPRPPRSRGTVHGRAARSRPATRAASPTAPRRWRSRRPRSRGNSASRRSGCALRP
ncbi:beta-ketoacyl synthase N-terminal-like domain-containing protein [Agromyces flavus]|uniref:thiolase family protein n=1 Tax=Agromyces flavus TaxID=589382 RepID=UPI00360DE553